MSFLHFSRGLDKQTCCKTVRLAVLSHNTSSAICQRQRIGSMFTVSLSLCKAVCRFLQTQTKAPRTEPVPNKWTGGGQWNFGKKRLYGIFSLLNWIGSLRREEAPPAFYHT
ncbi:hypothetical protein GDO81_011047 [Engystomops pustulosus]|uniref:Uncharacterized protein n=1 Tax=Engystomops pustulosus TaxID=76066 RepID=A0AAV7C5V2_ENGPU|nr:hypothetical protein GDO81_011047 [Engystomops pustulosus]